MKKAFYIIAGLAIFFVSLLVGFTLWMITKVEFEKNQAKTAPARANRWKDKPQTEEEINKILDDINENKNKTDEGKTENGI